MTIKLSKLDLMLLLGQILSNTERYRFITKMESDLSMAVLRELSERMLKKQFSISIRSFKISIAEALVLNVILPQIKTHDNYSESVLYPIYEDINKFCLTL